MHDEINGGSQLFAHRNERQRNVSHKDQSFESTNGIGRRIGMTGRQRSVVTGVHGLQHVDGLARANLAHHDSIGTHPQCIPDEFTYRNLTGAFGIGWARLQTQDVPPGKTKFGGVFDCDNTLMVGDESCNGVEQCGLSRSGAAAHDDVAPRLHRPLKQAADARSAGLGDVHTPSTESTNRKQRTIDSKRRHHAIDTRPIGKTRIDPWRRAINSQAKGRDDSFEQCVGRGTVDDHPGAFETAMAFHPKIAAAIDHDLVDGGVGKERIENTKAASARMNTAHNISN
jgi:hypothetical protein